MLRKLIIFSICAGLAALAPGFFENAPGPLRNWVDGGEEGGQAPVASRVPSKPAKNAASGRVISIVADPRGHFHAEFKINGRRVEGLIDTGASLIAVNESTARRLGLKLAPGDFRHEVSTANGLTRAAAATLQSVSLGRIHLENVEAAVLKDDALDGTLVGMSFLRRLDSFRVEDGTLVLKQ